MPPDGPPDYTIFIVLAAAAALLRLGRWLWRTCRLPAPPRPVADRIKDTLSTVAFGGFFVLGPPGIVSLMAGTLVPLFLVGGVWGLAFSAAWAFDCL
jgi:hypothetical protein